MSILTRQSTYTIGKGISYYYLRGDMCPTCKAKGWIEVKGHPCLTCNGLGIVGDITQEKAPKEIVPERKKKLYDLFSKKG